MTDPAFVVNHKIRAEIIELATCVGLSGIAEAAKEDNLVSVVGLIFAEIAHLDGQIATAEARAKEDFKATAFDPSHYEQTIAILNKRIAEQNLLLMTKGLIPKE